MTRRLLIGTRSRHKLEELRELLELPEAELVSPEDVGVEGDPIEDADTFRGNAEIKVRYYAAASGLATLADDSGLEVDALDGGPGIRTKRYAGEGATDEDNNHKLLRVLSGRPAGERGARYVCALAYLDPAAGAEVAFADSTFEGRIAMAPRGSGGFGYDPIFEPSDAHVGGRTVAELSVAVKHELSHRGRAARAMAERLRGLGW